MMKEYDMSLTVETLKSETLKCGEELVLKKYVEQGNTTFNVSQGCWDGSDYETYEEAEKHFYTVINEQ